MDIQFPVRHRGSIVLDGPCAPEQMCARIAAGFNDSGGVESSVWGLQVSFAVAPSYVGWKRNSFEGIRRGTVIIQPTASGMRVEYELEFALSRTVVKSAQLGAIAAVIVGLLRWYEIALSILSTILIIALGCVSAVVNFRDWLRTRAEDSPTLHIGP